MFLLEWRAEAGIIGQTKADDVTIADYRTKCGNIVDLNLESRKSFLESDLDHLYNSGYSIVYDENEKQKNGRCGNGEASYIFGR